jgi:hypothetical protein
MNDVLFTRIEFVSDDADIEEADASPHNDMDVASCSTSAQTTHSDAGGNSEDMSYNQPPLSWKFLYHDGQYPRQWLLHPQLLLLKANHLATSFLTELFHKTPVRGTLSTRYQEIFGIFVDWLYQDNLKSLHDGIRPVTRADLLKAAQLLVFADDYKITELADGVRSFFYYYTQRYHEDLEAKVAVILYQLGGAQTRLFMIRTLACGIVGGDEVALKLMRSTNTFPHQLSLDVLRSISGMKELTPKRPCEYDICEYHAHEVSGHKCPYSLLHEHTFTERSFQKGPLPSVNYLTEWKARQPEPELEPEAAPEEPAPDMDHESEAAPEAASDAEPAPPEEPPLEEQAPIEDDRELWLLMSKSKKKKKEKKKNKVRKTLSKEPAVDPEPEPEPIVEEGPHPPEEYVSYDCESELLACPEEEPEPTYAEEDISTDYRQPAKGYLYNPLPEDWPVEEAAVVASEEASAAEEPAEEEPAEEEPAEEEPAEEEPAEEEPAEEEPAEEEPAEETPAEEAPAEEAPAEDWPVEEAVEAPAEDEPAAEAPAEEAPAAAEALAEDEIPDAFSQGSMDWGWGLGTHKTHKRNEQKRRAKERARQALRSQGASTSPEMAEEAPAEPDSAVEENVDGFSFWGVKRRNSSARSPVVY